MENRRNKNKHSFHGTKNQLQCRYIFTETATSVVAIAIATAVMYTQKKQNKEAREREKREKKSWKQEWKTYKANATKKRTNERADVEKRNSK